MYHEDLYAMQRNSTQIPDAQKGWKAKIKTTTMFPPSWSDKRIMEEVAFANMNRTNPRVFPPNVIYSATTKSGLKIEIIVDPANGKIKTAYAL